MPSPLSTTVLGRGEEGGERRGEGIVVGEKMERRRERERKREGKRGRERERRDMQKREGGEGGGMSEGRAWRMRDEPSFTHLPRYTLPWLPNHPCA